MTLVSRFVLRAVPGDRQLERTHSELVGWVHRRARLVVIPVEVGDRWSDETGSSCRKWQTESPRWDPPHEQTGGTRAEVELGFHVVVCSGPGSSHVVAWIAGVRGADGETPSAADVEQESPFVGLAGWGRFFGETPQFGPAARRDIVLWSPCSDCSFCSRLENVSLPFPFHLPCCFSFHFSFPYPFPFPFPFSCSLSFAFSLFPFPFSLFPFPFPFSSCFPHESHWVNKNTARCEDTGHHWKDKFMGGHPLQCIVNVGKMRTLIWCRKWGSGPREWVRQAFKGRYVSLEIRCCPINSESWSKVIAWEEKEEKWQERGRLCAREASADHKGEFQSLCDLHDDGTFMAQCGLWRKMENKLVDIQIWVPDLFDEISESKMLHSEDNRACALRGREFGGRANVQGKIRFCWRRTKWKKQCDQRASRG